MQAGARCPQSRPKPGSWAEALIVGARSQNLLDGIPTLLAPGVSKPGPTSQRGARRAQELNASRTGHPAPTVALVEVSSKAAAGGPGRMSVEGGPHVWPGHMWREGHEEWVFRLCCGVRIPQRRGLAPTLSGVSRAGDHPDTSRALLR